MAKETHVLFLRSHCCPAQGDQHIQKVHAPMNLYNNTIDGQGTCTVPFFVLSYRLTSPRSSAAAKDERRVARLLSNHFSTWRQTPIIGSLFFFKCFSSFGFPVLVYHEVSSIEPGGPHCTQTVYSLFFKLCLERDYGGSWGWFREALNNVSAHAKFWSSCLSFGFTAVNFKVLDDSICPTQNKYFIAPLVCFFQVSTVWGKTLLWKRQFVHRCTTWVP